MRLSDAGLRRHPTKLIYLNHRPPPWLTEDATPRSLEPIVSGSSTTTPITWPPALVRNRYDDRFATEISIH